MDTFSLSINNLSKKLKIYTIKIFFILDIQRCNSKGLCNPGWTVQDDIQYNDADSVLGVLTDI